MQGFTAYNNFGDLMKARYNIIAFVIIGALGAISHFIYEWSGENKILGYFFATNESTWEHLKLLFFPTLLYSIFEYYFVKEKYKNYYPSVIISVIIGMISIVVLFYTYSGVLGYIIDFINILIFYIALVITLYVKNKIIKSKKFNGPNNNIISGFIAFIITLLFIFLTYNPPRIALFMPPNQ